ncbi:MAG: hypothetical protein MI810_14685 [Flavobacteriales bacterium]|nr:hypothetical protein [Flavobacteriales bacterium]
MERGSNKNMDELFAMARDAKVDIPLEKVAKTILAGAAVGTATATAAAVTGKSILTLSTPTIMTGTLITAAVTATTIVAVNADESTEKEIQEPVKEQYIEPAPVMDTEEDGLPEETIQFEEAVVTPVKDDEPIEVTEKEPLEVFEELAEIPKPEGNGEKHLIVLSSSDSKDEFHKKADEIRARGVELEIDKLVLKGEDSHLAMSFADDREGKVTAGNVNFHGPFELEFLWDDKDRFVLSHSGSGTIDIVETSSVEDEGRHTVSILSTSSDSESGVNEERTQIIVDEKGETIIITNSDGDVDSLNYNFNFDFDFEFDEQMRSMEIEMGKTLENLERERDRLEHELDRVIDEMERVLEEMEVEIQRELEENQKRMEEREEENEEKEKEKNKNKDKDKDKEEEKED